LTQLQPSSKEQQQPESNLRYVIFVDIQPSVPAALGQTTQQTIMLRVCLLLLAVAAAGAASG
jgi:hypothetical protein